VDGPGFSNERKKVFADAQLLAGMRAGNSAAFAGFRGGSSLATWLSWIVSNAALGRLRRRRYTVDISEMTDTLAVDVGPLITTEPTPERAIAGKEIRNAIEKVGRRAAALFP
jgi:DNA-directed RNA polymerase specialized sigma24 family protein